MNRRRLHEAALWALLLGACAALVLTEPASAQTLPGCASAPADFEPPMPNDAAIETRELRQDAASNCDALVVRLDRLTERADLTWWGSWAIVGLLLASIASPMLWTVFRGWSA